ncbi:hypothetical protein AMJ39_03295 [candidate division TA06 bacterium DG_24]|uniref:Peptidase C1A papain C-terminal domain-containing protein n=3 Tax=Bacteria division TA06 TaxID=1156500 RepID=A0A0S8JF46_UNCT6|nr:MAG: hypothetical protein AMJ39_03295 [candidate division TA06 bacterium DG_24]KPL07452.1 MAG: hypothetical protein AMJ71_08980 [candidate division TA06 bacterium SM1_40]
MKPHVYLCLVLVSLAVLISGTRLPAHGAYRAETAPHSELTRSVVPQQQILDQAADYLAVCARVNQARLEEKPDAIIARELYTLYEGTAAGTPRLLFDEDGPLCWWVAVCRDGVVGGFLTYHPYTGELMSTPGWKPGGRPVFSIDRAQWENLESLALSWVGLEEDSDARLILIPRGDDFVLYFGIPAANGLVRIDVTSLGMPGGLCPRLLTTAPLRSAIRNGLPLATREEASPSEERAEPRGELDLPIPDVFSLAVLPTVRDQDGYGSCVGHAAMITCEWWECGRTCYDGTGDSHYYTCDCEKGPQGECECLFYPLSREYMYDRSRTWPEQLNLKSDCGRSGFCASSGCGQGACTNAIVTDGTMMIDNPYCGQCAGSWMSRAAEVITHEGCCTEECQPYPEYMYAGPEHAGCTNGGREACTGQCPNVSGPCGNDFTLKSHHVINDVLEIPNSIYRHGMVLGGSSVCSPCFYGAGCLCLDCPCSILGGHAYALYGYDNTATPERFLFQNSWGTGWGYGGRGVMGVEAYDKLSWPGETFYFVGGKDLEVEVRPAGAVVPQGGTLSIIVTVTNNTNEPKDFYGWTDVIMPGGQPFPGNPVAGPVPVSLGPRESAQRTVNHSVPATAPLGLYEYRGCVGTPPNMITDDDLCWFVITLP